MNIVTLTKEQKERMSAIFTNISLLAEDEDFQNKLTKAYATYEGDDDKISVKDDVWEVRALLENIIDSANISFRDTTDWDDED